MTMVDGVDMCWGIDALRQRLRGEQIRNASLQRDYGTLVKACEKMQRHAARLYELLSPEVKAALAAAEASEAEERAERTAEMLRHIGIGGA